MSLPTGWAARLRLPVICAPMFRVTNVPMLLAARRAGIIGALPRANAPSFEEFDRWMATVLDADPMGPWRPPLAVNLSTRMPVDELDRHLSACRRRGVELIISATGNPAVLIQRARDHGLLVFSDAVNLRFADKAIEAGADGVIAIGSGGGGHSGTVNHLTLVAAIRRRFAGPVVMAGAVDSGAAVRAAEVLGADLAYVGTRFIACDESDAPEAYKQMLVSSTLADLRYTDQVNGVPANWLLPSLRRVGLDPDQMPARVPGGHGHGHLPPGAVPWSTLWSAGQGVELVDRIRPLADLVQAMAEDYARACAQPAFGVSAGSGSAGAAR